MKLISFDTIDSTNSYLKKNYEALTHFTWVKSEIQTLGRGRTSKVWFGDNESLLASLLLKENVSIATLQRYALLAATVLHKVLSKYSSVIKIKWPNDLLIGKNKLAGILIESVIESTHVKAVMIGFGINLNQSHFSNDLKSIATSLKLATDQTYDKMHILEEIDREFKETLHMFNQHPEEIIAYCNTHHQLTNRSITFMHDNHLTEGYVIMINELGELVIHVDEKIISINSGSVQIKE